MSKFIKWGCLVVTFILGFSFSLGVAFIVGHAAGMYQERANRFRQEQAVVVEILKRNQLSHLEVGPDTGTGAAYVWGVVSSQEEVDHLRKELEKALGTSEGNRAGGVSIGTPVKH